MPDKEHDPAPRIVAREQELNPAYGESRDLHRRLIETVRSGIFLTEVHGKLTYVNHAFVEMLGYNTKDQVVATNFFEDLFFDPEGKKAFFKRMQETGFVRDFETRHRRRDGTDIVVSLTCNYIYNDRGAVIGAEGVIQDITDKKRLEEELVTEKRKLEQILAFDEQIGAVRDYDKLVDFIIDKTALLLEVKRCSLMLLDKDGQGLFIQGARGLDEKTVKDCHMQMGQMVAGYVAESRTPMLVKNIEYDERFKRSSKIYYFSRSFISVPVILEHKLIGVINVTDHAKSRNFNEIDLRILGAVAREVAVALENAELYKQLNYLTITDPLTLIYNYRQFSQSLNYEIKRRGRVAGHLCLIILDIDGFKAYNDTFGHLEGDDLLKGIGKIFKSQLRETDIVCRYAGDEFAIILPDISLEGAGVAAEKIRQAVEGAVFKSPVTVSVGVAAHTKGLSQYDFIMKADRALYQAKREGKNRVSAQP
ncbi:MAG: diguanylate cyclase [Candidatus Omnitrophica bacterium]|nr:diguanylate cyclase [Candidatus Omnitrophota bacterium]